MLQALQFKAEHLDPPLVHGIPPVFRGGAPNCALLRHTGHVMEKLPRRSPLLARGSLWGHLSGEGL